MSLIVTQGGRPQPSTRLNTLLKEVENAGEEIDLSPSARRLLTFLQGNPQRVSQMPQPTEEGAYTFDKGNVVECINRAQYVYNPSVDFKAGVSDKAKILISDYAQGLNKYLTSYMKTEGAQRIINYCRQKIDSHSSLVETLRTEFKQFKDTLKTLKSISIDAPMEIVNKLSPFIDTKDISKTIELLSFFKQIKNDITYSVQDWTTALYDTVKNKIKGLTIIPQEECENNILTLKGVLVGTSDINAALKTHPNPTEINVYGLNTLFIDENVTSQGTSCSLLAPQWKIIDTRNINLSGNSGVDGAHGSSGSYGGASGSDGQPGKPGDNGGHFYGKGFIFNHLDQLTTTTNGGKGGNGGNGGNGANGTDGRDGDLYKVTDTYYGDANAHLMLMPILNMPVSQLFCSAERAKSAEYKFEEYCDQGIDGGTGGNAGRRGSGARGGNFGSSVIDGHQWSSTPDNRLDGSNGKEGSYGKGGQHGRNCTGTLRQKNTVSLGVPLNGLLSIGMGLVNLIGADWVSESKHLDRSPSSADNGQPAYGINDSEQQSPADQTPFNSVPIIQQYKVYYSQEADNPIVNPFLKVFPNL